MAASSWPWLRSLLACATSLLLIALPVAGQEESDAATSWPQSVSGMVAQVKFEAEASLEQVTLNWRPLGPSPQGDAPRLELLDPAANETRTPFGGEVTLIFAIGGRQADIAMQLALADRLGRDAVERGASVVLARLSPEFEVLANVSETDALRAALNTVPTAITPSADTVRTLPGAFQYAVDTGGRKALFAGTDALPVEDDVRLGVVSAAMARKIYLFPVTQSADGSGLQPYAEITGGRLVGGGPDPTILDDVFGGEAVTFRFPAHLNYLLPGEEAAPVILQISVGDQVNTFELGRDTPVLDWAGVLVRAINPGHWMGWIGQEGRQIFGFAGLLSNVALLGVLFLIVRGFMAGRRSAPRAAATPEPIPDVTLAPLRKIIGRKPGCDYVLEDPSVSRHHANLFQTGIEMWITDENSTNGTFIFRLGEWVQTEHTPVEIGDRLRFGDCEVSVEELVRAVDLVPPEAGAAEPDAQALQRFRKPRRNPYTGKIEEGAN